MIMGALGLIAGWLVMVPVAVIEIFRPIPALEWAFTLIPGPLLGFILFVPLLLWQQRSQAWILLGLMLAVPAGAFHIWCLNTLPERDWASVDGFAVVGTMAGLAYLLAGLAVNRRREWWMLLPVIAVSGLTHAAFRVSMEAAQNQITSLPFELGFAISISFGANLFSATFSALGITLGSALWDRTSPPKFEFISHISREEGTT
jgi:hypothetical protein